MSIANSGSVGRGKSIHERNVTMINEMDNAFLEYDTNTKIRAYPELLVAAVMMCKFMVHNKMSMREAGIPGTLMDECYKAIRKEIDNA